MGAAASAMGWPDELTGLLVTGVHRSSATTTATPGAPPAATSPPARMPSDLARDAVGVLDGYGIGAAHVVGASMGGILGQLLALDHRDRLRTLTVMLSPALDVFFFDATFLWMERKAGLELPHCPSGRQRSSGSGGKTPQ